MLQTVALCSVSEFRKAGHEVDKNGNQNVFLSPLSGTIPNKCMVLAGSVAINHNIEIGSTYVFKFTEIEESKEYGRQFNTQVIAKASVMDIMQASKSNDAKVLNVSGAVTTETSTENVFANTESEFEKSGK